MHVWKVSNIEEDVTSRSIHTLSTNGNPINQIAMINWTSQLAVAGQGGVKIFDLERNLTSSSGSSGLQIDGKSYFISNEDMDS